MRHVVGAGKGAARKVANPRAYGATLRSVTVRPLANLHPAHFAPVMATGIVSIAAKFLGLHTVAAAMFALNLALYAGSWLATLARLALHRDRVWADARDHGRAVGFFTAVAATSVVGSQCLVIAAWPRAAAACWVLSVALWAVLTYALVTVLVVRREKPVAPDGFHGGWLLVVVAAQSVAALGAQVAPTLAAHGADALLLCLGLWLSGSVLYLWIAGALFTRLLLLPVSAPQLTPPYWINMGAVAITTWS